MEYKSERRGFLRGIFGGIGVSVASILGLSGTVSGHSVEKKAERIATAKEYHTTERVHHAVKTNAHAVLNELSEREYLESGSVLELPTDKLHDSIEGFAQASEGAMVFGILRDGEPTVRIEVKKELESGEIKVVVFPERDHSFAVVSHKENGSAFDSAESKEIVSVSSDCDCNACFHDKNCGVGCGPYSCSCVYEYWPTQCCSDCCYTGDSCSSCDKDYC